MSFPIWRTVGTVAGGVFGGPAGAAAGGAIGGSFDDSGNSDKVNGVPTPRDGTTQGLDYRGFLDGAYPGTTAWERLGANSPMGAISSAEIGAKNAREMQDRELTNRSAIADSTNRAHVIGSMAQFGPEGVNSGLSSYAGGPGSPYDSVVRQGRERLPFETASDESRTRRDREASKTDEDTRPARKSLLESEARMSAAHVPYAGMNSYWDAVGKATGALIPGAGLFAYLRNSGKAPRRFKFDPDKPYGNY